MMIALALALGVAVGWGIGTFRAVRWLRRATPAELQYAQEYMNGKHGHKPFYRGPK